MASDKRDFSDFHNFPGDISKKEASRGWYSFPPVHTLDTMGRRRVWNIWVRLITTKDGKAPARRKINWDTNAGTSDTNADIVVPLLKKHLDGEGIPKNTIAQMWTTQGIDLVKDLEKNLELKGEDIYKMTVSIPTYVTVGKNLGKKNATNVLTQALIQARSKYLKKMQESSERENRKRFFPFAVHKYDAVPKDTTKHLRLPIAVQRKLDGGRACAYYDTDLKVPVMYTRKLKDLYGNDHVLEELKIFFTVINDKYPGVYLDGELYKHGLSLQTISGMMRRDKTSKTAEREMKDNPDKAKLKLQYHIFDLFFPNGKKTEQEMPYAERKIIMDDIFKIAGENVSLKFLVKVKTHIVSTFEEETKLYEQFLGEKYEGSIVRNLDALYEFGVNKEIRTYQVRKRKPRYSAEYEIVGYTEGTQGKDTGAIIWILTTGKDDGKKKKIVPLQFTSTPVGMDYEERYSLFKNMTPETFSKNYKGKPMTVEYDDISEDGVPLRAKAKGVRLID
jgi:ATP-dependent DNA ligase